LLDIGQEPDVGTGAMLLRVLVVFVFGVVAVRIGHKRLMGELSAMDLIVAVMLGSIFSRAITGNAPFVAALASGFGLVVVHRIVARLAYGSERFGTLLKGEARKLIDDGEIRWDTMRAADLGEADLMAALRRKAQLRSVADVEVAYLERTGDISVIPKK
jgi:uncharacterized membrane protein YcaP (DUF421 family)